MPVSLSLADLLALLPDAQADGAADRPVTGIAALGTAGPGDLSFLGNPKYRPQVEGCRATILLLPRDFPGHPPAGQAWLRVAKPTLALAVVTARLERELDPPPVPGVHPTAVIAPDAVVGARLHAGPYAVVESGAVLGDDVVLGAHAFVGRNSRVGDGTRLYPRATVLDRVVVGARCRLFSGCVVGSDGFGYEPTGTENIRLPQIGTVVLEDDVDLGANVTIDRARFGVTRIGRGTKFDNLVHVGHNVEVGPLNLWAAQTGVAGSTVFESHVMTGGQAGIAGHLRVGRGSQIGGQAGVTGSLPPGSKVTGSPARPMRDQYRALAALNRLPDLLERVARLEAAAAAVDAPPPGTED